MASLAGSSCSSSGAVFRAREVGGNNGAFLGHYNGLRPMENVHMVPSGTKSSGFVSTSGNLIMSRIKILEKYYLLSVT